jgi:glycosyltransferase involved in cell wall biosynthesis
MKKLVYIVSDIDKSLHFEWITILLRRDFDLRYILIGKRGSELEKFLRHNQIDTVVIEFAHSRFKIPAVWMTVARHLRRQRPDIVHTHLWIANLIGLSAAFMLGIKQRIFTRHHAVIHHTEFPSGRKWDSLVARLATHIIAPSANVMNILVQMEHVPGHKVHMIHHGFDLPYFEGVGTRHGLLKQKYRIPHDAFVFGVISRFVEWKGIQFILPAFEKIVDQFPNAYLVLANASGNYEPEINRMLSKVPRHSFTIVKFENDLAALYSLFDAFIHIPVDSRVEAFGQTYIESLIAGVPSIFTLSGVAAEVIRPDVDALVVDFKNTNQVYQAMTRLIQDSGLRARLIEQGKITARDFSIEKYAASLKLLYLS